ncbi:protein WALLS ARE THIN 1 [Selaginella moellendorffii]|uniref:protein WALLS ARE THIN 1 n=1 Tax=Selaginella moellendorffii TaxID=88036 RepID=UPI000D1C9EC2|nr:protein WALLS ARE THIN 1 [Selaginella moellendorffii]|eukprot:XP_024535902.1 protein WALLS ARE THIN 1 [Selaginella moellendorffii]
MEEKKADFAIDSEEIHVPLPLPPAATANSIRFFDNEQPISLPSSRLRFHVVLIVAQAGFAGYEVLVRRRFGKGSSIIVYSVYKNCLGFMVLRFLSSFVEKVCVSELCYLQGLKYTTPIFASAMRNVIPAFTFIFALIFRMEKVDIEKSHGIVKLVGTILLICGWMTLLVYKGQELLMSHFS